MKKLRTLFVKENGTGKVINQINSGAEWVLNGEGRATIKIDGSSVLKKGYSFYKRMDRKLSKKFAIQKRKNPDMPITSTMFKEAQIGWIPAEDEPNLKSGHWPGWMLLDRTNPSDKWHFEAIDKEDFFEDGTYELIGPTLMMNIYGLESHKLIRHGIFEVNVERNFESIKKYLEDNYIEGLVFHRDNENEDMFKIRRKDFGIVWNPYSDPREYPNWNQEVPKANINYETTNVLKS